MNIGQPARQSVPLLRGSEEQVVKLRKRLEEVFRNVSLAHDVVTICIELRHGNSGDFNAEMAHVLRRCAADKLRFQMGVLTTVIERLGGTTAFSSAEAALVHNIVFSIPSPTPPEKVLAAARKFAREKFALQHRYAMALHTDQRNPHVHMVVKAESEQGRRLHIDKAMLREWREDFARLMREQGIAANATPRVVRGRNKGKTRDAIYRAQQRGTSHVVRERVTAVTEQLMRTGSFHDPSRDRLLETRKSVVGGWLGIADALDIQGEVVLAGDVRHFARHLPRLLTDREFVATGLINHLGQRSHKGTVTEGTRVRPEERTR